MMKYLVICLFALCGCGTQPTGENKSFEFDLRWLALKDKVDCKIVKTPEFGQDVLLFQPSEKNNSIIISGIGSRIDWSRAKYFICEVHNPCESSELICFDFYAKKNDETSDTKEVPVISPKIEIFPKQITKLVLPLNILKGESVSIERIPGQSVAFDPGESLDPKNIGAVHVSLSGKADMSSDPKIEIASMYLSNVKPENKLDPNHK